MDGKVKISIALKPFDDAFGLVDRDFAQYAMSICDKCDEVTLDFSGVKEIHPDYADEIFRVWQGSHPETKIVVQEANEYVWERIRTASKGAS